MGTRLDSTQQLYTHDTTMARSDTASQSNYLSVRTTHLHLDWTIDWDDRKIAGSVTHTLEAQHDGVDEICLDASYLDISGAYEASSSSSSSSSTALKYTLGDRHPVLGNKLTIVPAKPLGKNESVQVRIEYSTTKKCTALGWLEPHQTASGRHPFLYSQCQAIHMRSLAPVQDTPSVKSAYTAKVSSYLPVLLSALRLSPPSEQTEAIEKGKMTEYTYNQPVPIPSYLIAIASGELAFKKVGPRTGVWSDPATLDKAVWEFEEDMEIFLQHAEKLLPPYEFGDYDVLVLPPSFPFGGMENSNLTFLTPTLLAGDRSLVDVVAHELSHSWFGNNVGCKDWSNFWLNEGWTTYCERLLIREKEGEAGRGFSYIIGRKSLKDSLKGYEKKGEKKYQKLVVPAEFGDDPDDAFSTVPYDKGSNLLLHLERTVGGLEVFLPYMHAYVTKFRGKSIGTADWREHLFSYFAAHPKASTIVPALEKVDWEAWLHGDGLDLPVDIKYDTSMADKAYDLAKRWDAARKEDTIDFSAKDLEGFSSNQTVVFLETLESYDSLPPKYLREMNKCYGFDDTENAEIRLRWYNVALAGDGEDFKESAAKWVVTVGRMKMCRPITSKLFACDEKLAVKTFLAAEAFYHPIAAAQLRKDLKLPPA